VKVIFRPDLYAFISYSKNGMRGYRIRPDDTSEEVETAWNQAWQQAKEDDR
jgi:hypothetical protein